MPLFTLLKETENYIKIQKKTHELDIIVEISTEFDCDLKPDTTLDFLDHCIETLSWGLCMSIGCTIKTGKWRSTHTIAEDLAITIGAGLKKLFFKKLHNKGINIGGWALYGVDDSLVRTMVALEGRRNTYISYSADCPGAQTETCEDLKTADLVAWVEGFCQGFPATLHVDFIKGKDPHHSWEAAFQAMGEALRMAYATNPWRIAKNNPYYAEEGIADASMI
jgi:imidazoleglycerol-phosphate dehydratase